MAKGGKSAPVVQAQHPNPVKQRIPVTVKGRRSSCEKIMWLVDCKLVHLWENVSNGSLVCPNIAIDWTTHGLYHSSNDTQAFGVRTSLSNDVVQQRVDIDCANHVECVGTRLSSCSPLSTTFAGTGLERPYHLPRLLSLRMSHTCSIASQCLRNATFASVCSRSLCFDQSLLYRRLGR